MITIFSQFGEPTFLKLVRDKETGKSKGFGWLKYENQKSTDLAVDNLGGSQIGGRLISVDHARYKARDDEDQDEFRVGWEDMQRREGKPVSDDESSEDERRPMLPEEIELAKLIHDHDDDDPMKGFLIEEKKKEVEEAQARAKLGIEKHSSRHSRKHHRSHRSRGDDGERRKRHRSRTPTDGDRRRRHRDSRHRSRRDDDDPRRSKDSRRGEQDRHHDDHRSRDHDKDRRREDRDDSSRHRRREQRSDGESHSRRSRTRSPRKDD